MNAFEALALGAWLGTLALTYIVWRLKQFAARLEAQMDEEHVMVWRTINYLDRVKQQVAQ